MREITDDAMGVIGEVVDRAIVLDACCKFLM